jgi:short-subunit dehydrogenase
MTTTSDNRFAVITGGSSGIGYELARQLAMQGFDLLIVAEDAGVEEAAADLRRDGRNQVTAIRADLAQYDGVEQTWAAIEETGRDLDVLALNAGRGIGGEFVGGTALADELNVIDVNVTSTVHLAKRALPGMVARGRGRVLITSSIAAMMPGTY